MRPIRSFLLLLIFLACFTGLHYIIQANQFFPSILEFVPADLVSDLFTSDKDLSRIHVDKLPDALKSISADSVALSDSIPQPAAKIPFDPLKGFLDSLRYSSSQQRIMYYGDSQIEGDRITSYLRQTLRKGHGGTGPGLFMPLMPVMYTKSLWLRSTSNWKKYNYLSYKAGEISHRNLGPFMAICRYLPEGEKTAVIQKASVRIRASNFADSSASRYDILRVFYGNTEGVVRVKIKADDSEIFADTLKRGKGFNEIMCQLNGAKEIFIEFEGKVSPDIYGISIESNSGVIIDNIPQRGSAGLEFTMVDRENLSEAYKKLSPDLIILHYGLNIVKNVRGDYSYYQKGLERQFSLLKEISPLTAILMISVTDMAAKEGDSIKSYRNIPAIIEAQKKATLDAGIAFWDSYSAMGGKSSIIRWEEKKLPLAQKDYIHFTYQGADTLARLLVNALFSDRETDINRQEYSNIRADTTILVQPVPVVESVTEIKEKSLISSFISSVFKYDPDKPLIFSTPAFWLFFLLVLAGYSLIYKKLFIRNVIIFSCKPFLLL